MGTGKKTRERDGNGTGSAFPCKTLLVIQRLGFIILYTVYLCEKFDDSSFSPSRDIVGGPKTSSGSHDLDHAPFKGDLSSLCRDLT